VRNTASNDIDMWAPARRSMRPTTAAIAGLWQFWLDPTMSIAVILPPGDADFSLFPFGENAIGRGLFESAGISAHAPAAIDFSHQFETRQKIHNVRFTLKNARGIEKTLLVNGAVIWGGEGDFEGYRCTVAEIPHAATTAQDLQRNDAVLNAFIRHGPNLIVIKDVEGRYVAVNPLAERSYGLPSDQLLGKTAAEVLPPRHAAECIKEDNAVLDSESIREVEQNFCAPDGPRTFHTVKFPIFDGEHSLIGTGAIGIDVSQHKTVDD
jgi:PAS domain S-box-containing protein